MCGTSTHETLPYLHWSRISLDKNTSRKEISCVITKSNYRKRNCFGTTLALITVWQVVLRCAGVKKNIYQPLVWLQSHETSLWLTSSLVLLCLCQACRTTTRAGETTCSSLRPETSSPGQTLARTFGTQLHNPDEKSPLLVFSPHIPSAARHGDSRDVFRHVLCRNAVQTQSWQQLCGVLGGTRGTVWPQVKVLVQVSQVWDKTWHATPMLQKSSEVPTSLKSKIVAITVVMMIMVTVRGSVGINQGTKCDAKWNE